MLTCASTHEGVLVRLQLLCSELFSGIIPGVSDPVDPHSIVSKPLIQPLTLEACRARFSSRDTVVSVFSNGFGAARHWTLPQVRGYELTPVLQVKATGLHTKLVALRAELLGEMWSLESTVNVATDLLPRVGVSA